MIPQSDGKRSVEGASGGVGYSFPPSNSWRQASTLLARLRSTEYGKRRDAPASSSTCTATPSPRRWVLPGWLVALLSPTAGCDCYTCRAIRAEYRRLDTQTQRAPKAVKH